MSDSASGSPVEMGRAALDSGRYADAVPLLREAILDDPGDATLRADLGIALENLEDYPAASQAYAAAAALDPQNPVYHFNQGAVAQAQGLGHEAAGHYLDALEREPLFAEAYFNLGTLFFEAGHLEIAAEHYGNALKARPDYAEAASNLGLTLRRLGKPRDAVEQFRLALSLRPDMAQTHANLGIALSEIGEFDEAIACYGRAMSFDPTNPNMHINLSLAWRGRGRTDLSAESALRALVLAPDATAPQVELGSVAAALFNEGKAEDLADLLGRWHKVAGDTPILLHTRAALGLEAVPERASDAYLSQTFDASAKRFDEMILGLGYNGPVMIAEALQRHLGGPAGNLEILDAGCGTGLTGLALRDYAQTLSGVDLSLGMLQQAARRNIYNRLDQAELTAYLIARPNSFDLIGFGDLFTYFGDLAAPLSAAAGSVKAGGLVVATLEAQSTSKPYVLGPGGRYAHSADYVSASLTAAGFTPLEVTPITLRQEGGRPVDGLLFVARRG
jgi:predicted TPR repeat methyltransferase